MAKYTDDFTRVQGIYSPMPRRRSVDPNWVLLGLILTFIAVLRWLGVL